MPKKSVFCIANCRNLAELIVDQLRFYKISPRDISILYPDLSQNQSRGHHSATQPASLTANEDTFSPDTPGSNGGSMSWIMGIKALALPGMGIYMAAGPILAALGETGPGASAGGISSGLVSLGIPDKRARHYEDRVRLGNILLSVHTESPAEAMQSKFIFTRGRAQDICITEEPVIASWKENAETHGEQADFSYNTMPALGGRSSIAFLAHPA